MGANNSLRSGRSVEAYPVSTARGTDNLVRRRLNEFAPPGLSPGVVLLKSAQSLPT